MGGKQALSKGLHIKETHINTARVWFYRLWRYHYTPIRRTEMKSLEDSKY